MTLSEELTWRGFVNQTTYKDIKVLDDEKLTFYHGFDASAQSQTIGNLAAMMADRLLIKHGYKAILLAGGATSLVGDPGGKDSERSLQDEDTIAKNVKNAEQQISKVFEGQDFKLVNNLDWTKDVKLIPFLRDIGKHFSMTSLVQRDYIAKRIGEGGSGISFAEFSYTLLQGYDYLHLYDEFGVTLQLGGSDQWGNCLSGVDLVRRSRNKEVNVITMPLIINQSTGQKFGKSEEGAIWLDEKLTSVYQFYQFWLNVDDEGAEHYLKIYTMLDKPAIEKIMADFNTDKSSRGAQKTLAYEVTKIVHGADRADSVKRQTEVLFGSEDYSSLEKDDFESLQKELPVATGADLISALVDAGLASSNTEARRFIGDGAISINGKKVSEDKATLTDSDLIHGCAIIKRGKNSLAIAKL